MTNTTLEKIIRAVHSAWVTHRVEHRDRLSASRFVRYDKHLRLWFATPAGCAIIAAYNLGGYEAARVALAAANALPDRFTDEDDFKAPGWGANILKSCGYEVHGDLGSTIEDLWDAVEKSSLTIILGGAVCVDAFIVFGLAWAAVNGKGCAIDWDIIVHFNSENRTWGLSCGIMAYDWPWWARRCVPTAW